MSKIYHTLSHEYIRDKLFPMNAVVLKLDNGMVLVCQNFKLRNDKMQLFCYLPKEHKWVITFKRLYKTGDPIPMFIYEYYKKHVYVKYKSCASYSRLMQHDRRHKKGGGGGTRLKNDKFTTDYECSKTPLHDFRKSMYVQWNQM